MVEIRCNVYILCCVDEVRRAVAQSVKLTATFVDAAPGAATLIAYLRTCTYPAPLSGLYSYLFRGLLATLATYHSNARYVARSVQQPPATQPQRAVVGLTGGIATGKSTVSKRLQSFGLPVVDADVIAREVVAPGTPALAKIVRAFGEDILLPDGALDRPKLGAIVFNDEAQRKVLNGIVHPAVWRAIFWAVVTNWLKGKRICVLDVPLLIEGGLYKWVAKVAVVYWCVNSARVPCDLN